MKKNSIIVFLTFVMFVLSSNFLYAGEKEDIKEYFGEVKEISYENDDAETTLKRLEELVAPNSCLLFKEYVINAWKKQVDAKNAIESVMESLMETGNAGDVDIEAIVQQKTDESAVWEEKADQEYYKIIKEYGIDDLP